MSATAMFNENPMHSGGEDVADSVDRSATNALAPGSAGGSSGSALADAKRYRKRAQAAEKELADARAALELQTLQLQEHQQMLASLQRQQQLDQLLMQQGALDLHAARAMAQAMMEAQAKAQATPSPSSGGEATTVPVPDMAQIVDDLRRSRPYLFRSVTAAPRSHTGAMSAAESDPRRVREDQVDQAAAAALESGRRIDLLRYLRLKRR